MKTKYTKTCSFLKQIINKVTPPRPQARFITTQVQQIMVFMYNACLCTNHKKGLTTSPSQAFSINKMYKHPVFREYNSYEEMKKISNEISAAGAFYKQPIPKVMLLYGRSSFIKKCNNISAAFFMEE